MKLRGRHFATRQPIEIETAGERIQAIRPLVDDQPEPANDHHCAANSQSQRQTSSDSLPWIAPGFVDLQINGYCGVEFNSPQLTSEGIAAVVQAIGRMGVTQFLPTMTTAPFSALSRAARLIAQSAEQDSMVGGLVAGIHLEGPYIAMADGPRGAHPLAYCRPPDWNEFQQLQEAASGRIRLVTLSPEYEGACAVIRRMVDSGVTVAIGHTSATCQQILAAVDAGASVSTHLGNGCHATLPRHPNYLWTQLADDRLSATLIVDGHHLPAEVVRTFIRAKESSRCILVSDLSAYAGMPPGEYSTELGSVEILPEGKIVVAGQRCFLAGAVLPIGACVAETMRMADIDLATAVAMASTRPASLVGARGGQLRAGDVADLVLFDLDLRAIPTPERLVVRQAICRGEALPV